MPERAPLIVIVGPIASGKSSLAARVSQRLLEVGRRSAVVDLDDVAECLVAPDAEWEMKWQRARTVHDELVAVFRRSGVDVVIAHGSLFYVDEPAAVPDGVHDTDALRVSLAASYDVALQRAASDPERGISKDPGFLRWAHDQFSMRAATLPEFGLHFDTTAQSIDEMTEDVLSVLLG